MRISDWSSDVCSSDLAEPALTTAINATRPRASANDCGGALSHCRLSGNSVIVAIFIGALWQSAGRDVAQAADAADPSPATATHTTRKTAPSRPRRGQGDRKSDVEGERV